MERSLALEVDFEVVGVEEEDLDWEEEVEARGCEEEEEAEDF